VAQEKISVIVVDDTDESREMILRMLQFDQDINIIGTGKTGLEAIEIAQKLKPDVMVMDINMPDMDGITATEAIRKKVPFVQILILSVQNDPNYMRRAMLAGARDFLTKPPQIDELTQAVRRAGAMAQEEKQKTIVQFTTGALTSALTGPLVPGMFIPQMISGKIISVYSPKGGTGCTTIATNLAASLKTPENKVAIVDANMLFGDVAVFLNEHGKNTILDLTERVEELDPEVIEDVMVINKITGLHIMSSPKEPELDDMGKGEAVSKVLRYMQQIYHYIIIDTQPYLTDIVQASMDVSDIIILITTQDIPCIKNVNQFLRLADMSSIGRSRLLFLMNKYDRRVAISPERVSQSLKQPVNLSIPFEDRVISNSMNRGIPFILENKGLESSKAIYALANMVKSFDNPENEK
jgi:pilus assembly protein CpaE